MLQEAARQRCRAKRRCIYAFAIMATLVSVQAWTPPGRSSALYRRSNHCFKTTSMEENAIEQSSSGRRDFLSRALGSSVTAAAILVLRPKVVSAADDSTDVYLRKTDQFAYEFQPPASFPSPSQKPLKTHLDEVNFKAENGYQYGITVDPVRITSLQDFGTPEEVAAKVVLAEVNRDGVFDVKLMEDPVSRRVADDNDSAEAALTFYQLNYLSSGKRGQKRFMAKFFIENQKLYALTAQCKEEDYGKLESEMLQAVKSFRVVRQ